jgi:hypothetical protein
MEQNGISTTAKTFPMQEKKEKKVFQALLFGVA